MKRSIQWILLASAMFVGCEPRENPPQVQVLTVPQPPQASQSPQPPQPPTPPAASGMGDMGGAVLKVYEVPKGYQMMLAEELQRLLIVGDRPLGKVRQMPGDQLMVLAPLDVHSGVESLLNTLKKTPAPEAMQSQDVVSQYWFVLAKQGQGPDSEGLDQIKDALAQVEAKQGAMQFKLLDQLTIRGSDGRESQVQSRYAQVTQRLFPASDRQTLGNLSISIQHRPLLDTEIHVRAGQTLVLGQVGYEDRDKTPNTIHMEGAAQADPAEILLIVARFEQQTP